MIEALQRQALIGVQGAAPAAAQTGDAAIDALLQHARHDARPAQALLRQVAFFSAAARASDTPQQPALPATVAPPDDPRPLLPERAGDLIAMALRGDDDDLITPLLHDATRAGWRLPETLLVALLAHAKTAEQKQRVERIEGPRIAWLAAINPAWGWCLPAAPSSPERAFDEQSGEARVRTLRAWRAIAPDAARERLIAGWAECAPDERAALLQTLATGLHAGDEALLETALDDRRKEVRSVAQDLLARLPGSQLVQRCTARVLPLLRIGGMLRKTLEIDLPAAHDKAMQRDGIDARPPAGRGERQHWLLQLLERVPPQQLHTHLQIEPDRLLHLLAAHADAAALLPSIATATLHSRDHAFIERWFGVIDDSDALADVFHASLLIESLQHDGAARLRAVFAQRKHGHLLWPQLPRLLETAPQLFDSAMLRLLLDTLAKAAAQKDWSARWTAAQALLQATLLLDPLDLPLDAWRLSPAAEPLSQREHARLLQRLDLRHQFALFLRSP